VKSGRKNALPGAVSCASPLNKNEKQFGEAVDEKQNRDHHKHEADEHPRDGVDAFLVTGGRSLGLELPGDGAVLSGFAG
jgi:hypothetical protein